MTTPNPPVLDLQDDDLQTFVLPASIGLQDPFIIKSGEAISRCTLSEIIAANGVVILSADDGSQVRIVLEQFANHPEVADADVGVAQESVWIQSNMNQQSTAEDLPIGLVPAVPEAAGKSTTAEIQPMATIVGNHMARPQRIPPPSHDQRFFQNFVWNIHSAPMTHNSFQPLGGKTSWRGGLMNHSAVADSRSGHVYVFGGSNGKGEENELYAYNSLIHQWRRVENSYRPWGRHGHVAVTFEGHMYITGGIGHNGLIPVRSDPPPPGVCLADETALYCNGYNEAPNGVPIGFLADMWSYNYEGSTWKNVANNPSMMCALHSGCVTSSGQFYLIGGLTPDNRSANIVHATQLPVQCSTMHCPRTAIIHIPDKGKYYCSVCQTSLHAMQRRSVPQNNFHWQRVNYTGAFKPRHNHTSVLCGHNIYVFGGSNETDGLLGDLMVLNLDTMAWTAHQVPAQSSSGPTAREAHAACVARNTMFIVGGQGAYERVIKQKSVSLFSSLNPTNQTIPPGTRKEMTVGPLDDAYMLNLITMQWTNLDLSQRNLTKGISHHVLVHMLTTERPNEPSRATFLCFGGKIRSKEVRKEGMQTFLLNGQYKAKKSKSLESSSRSITNVEDATTQRTSSLASRNRLSGRISTASEIAFEKYYSEGQINWRKKIEAKIEKTRAEVEGESYTKVCIGLHNADEAKLKSLATEVRGHKSAVVGLKASVEEQLRWEPADKVKKLLQEMLKHVTEIIQTMSEPEKYKEKLTQEYFISILTKIDTSLAAATAHLAGLHGENADRKKSALFEHFNMMKNYLQTVRQQGGDSFSISALPSMERLKSKLVDLSTDVQKQLYKDPEDKIKNLIQDVAVHITDISQAMSAPEKYKEKLSQQSLMGHFNKMNTSLVSATAALADIKGEGAQEKKSSLSEEFMSIKKDLNTARKQVNELFKDMTQAGVQHMVEYVKKHEIAIDKSRIKVTENFKASMWQGALNCGYKILTKDLKKEEDAWVKQRIQRLQQSFPHMLPKTSLDEMSRCIDDAVREADVALTVFDADPKDTSKVASSKVKAARHAAIVLRSMLEKENQRLKDGQTFRQAAFYGKFREYQVEADNAKAYVKDKVNNMETAEEAVKKLHKSMENFKKTLTSACDKIVVAAAKDMYRQGMDFVRQKQDIAKKAYGLEKKEVKKKDDGTPSVNDLRALLGKPPLENPKTETVSPKKRKSD